MATNKLDITAVDFNDLKESLKTFFGDQSEFQDFDFEGSAMNILLGILAYNTHYTAFHANMVVNEMFLDSASIRSSVVSLAKHLNFTPGSYTAADAKLDIIFNPDTPPTSVTIEKNTKFNTVIDGTTYTFVNLDALTIAPINGIFLATGFEIKEGTLLTYDIVKDVSNTSQKFIIPNKKVDVSTIKVIIQDSLGDTNQTVFTKADTIDVTALSTIFWVHEVEGELYELQFGNDVVGKALQDGNVVKIEYLVTSGEIANKASTFSAAGSIGGYNGNEVSFTVSQNSAGGGDIQSIEDIKFLAPKLYSTQDRAVTAEDYINILLNERSDIESITAWGGEDNVPTKFGEVFIAIKPKNSTTFSASTKLEIEQTILKKKNIVAINPTIVDADFTYIKMSTDVVYDSLQLAGTVSALEATVKSIIENYFTNTLSKFGAKLRTSVLTSLIDSSDISVLNSRSEVSMEKRFEPTLGTEETQTLRFSNAIIPSSIVSTKFTIGSNSDIWYADDGLGKIVTKQLIGAVATTIDSDTGSVDYDTGEVILLDNNILSISDSTTFVNVVAIPVIEDLIPVNDQIFIMDTADTTALTITMISETI